MARYHLRLDYHPDTLDDGRQINPGDEVQLSPKEAEEPSAARLIADGYLIPMTAAAEKTAENVAAHVAEDSEKSLDQIEAEAKAQAEANGQED